LTDTYDVIVVGAGIVGCACARQCAHEGMTVLLIDRDIIAGGTTAAGMGHIVVLDDSDSQFALCSYSRRLWAELAEQIPDELQWEKRGTLWVAAEEEEMELVRQKHESYARHNVQTEILDAHAMRQAEPNLRDGLCGGLRVAEDAVLYPPSAAKWLADDAAAHGTRIMQNTSVQAIDPSGFVVLEDGIRIHAGILINATGCWAQALNSEFTVFNRKGHLVVTNRYPDMIRHQVVELGYLKSAHTVTSDSVAFNIQPRKEGKLIIGSSRQTGVTDAAVDHDILSRMLKRAFEYIPKLKGIQAMRCWSGFRPATPDKLPLIGPCPDSENIWLATGHEGLGITTSLATGRLIVDTLLGREPEIAIDPYLPSRCATGESVDE